MTSHEYAKRQKEIAEFLLSRPEFDVNGAGPLEFFSYYDKEKFLAAVRAVGSGAKNLDASSTEVRFIPTGFPEVHISVPRNLVCRKVQEAVYECEPFLSADEVASLG